MPDANQNERLLIIIPAYNEQGAIRDVVNGVRKAVPLADVLVINDGSQDRTAQEAVAAGALVVQHPFNLGIGGAVQTGLKFARQQGYDYVIRLDGDGQHQAQEIKLFLSELRTRRADMVIGSRFLNTDVDWHIPWLRRVGIRFFGWAVSRLIGERATDTTSGFCGMNRPVVHILATYLPQDYPDVESRVIVHKAGLRQLEVPVNMRARMTGVSSINAWKSVYYALKVSLAMVICVLKDITPAERLFDPWRGEPLIHRQEQNGQGVNGHRATPGRTGTESETNGNGAQRAPQQNASTVSPPVVGVAEPHAHSD